MNNYQSLRNLRQSKFDALLTESKVFWAFSKEQFEENKTPLQEGEKYVSIGHGGYIPKFSNATFWKKQEEIDLWFKEEIKKNNLENEEILFELCNHECFYTGDYTEIFDLLDYPQEQIKAVFYQNLDKYQD